MFEVDHRKIKKWDKARPNQHEPLAPKSVDILCPGHGCSRSLVNLPLEWVLSHQRLLWARPCCAGCGETSWFILLDPPKNNSDEEVAKSKLFIHPTPPLHPMIPDGIEEISPNFVKIYAQAVAAEKLGLDELDGIGYRKALEFLIKDYLCFKFPEKSESIKTKFLGSCIKEYVQDQNIKSCAERAIWLANDETHYERRWQERDRNDLSLLLQLTLHWISNELLTAKYIASMKS